ncbi:hypothetical protein WJX84_003539, partial [Apatococcus fuscideae]
MFEFGRKLQVEDDEEEEPSRIRISPEGNSLMIGDQECRQGDCIYMAPTTFDQAAGIAQDTSAVQVPEYAAKGRYHKGGGNAGLRAWCIARISQLTAAKGVGKQAKQNKVLVKRFWRPEDISWDLAYKTSFEEIYADAGPDLQVSLDDIVGTCTVLQDTSIQQPGRNEFICQQVYNAKDGSFKRLSDMANGNQSSTTEAGQAADAKGKGKTAATEASAKGKASAVQANGKGKTTAAVTELPSSGAVSGARQEKRDIDDGIALATMDIFAGCGGLSEGLHQAGAAFSRWAIEYEGPAAEAFRLNHPGATVYHANCNVILAAAMQKAGQRDQCQACPEAWEEAGSMPPGMRESLPAPGQVDFLCGGPPCQGYSGMNRFNKGNWSMVQNSMVMAYLSFADFYRPRYFLLENVRNFVSHNKSFTFRLTLRTLIDMGYQVRFGVLNAGNYGVSQSRKRTFIWAAAPGNYLPSWPALLHIFRSPQLNISLPGGIQYCAVPQQEGAPLRAVAVRDVIADLPPISNGSAAEEMQYSGPAVSAFQKRIRASASVLKDHICKEMNELNLERCRCIPKGVPGADWRVLQEIVAADPSREKYKGQLLVPWCLPNTADRHNGWRGLFGRLDWRGHFPTSVTDPQPMGKVGQVFHPDQDRIVSVRECARAQ